jgi:hypothetical protein
MDLVDLEFLELGCLAGKKWSGAVFVDLELRGALPNTPLVVGAGAGHDGLADPNREPGVHLQIIGSRLIFVIQIRGLFAKKQGAI